MTIAFFAPLKAPTHGVPSGDRTMARGLIAALEHGGQRVTLASDLRIYDGLGAPDTQAHLAAQAQAEVARILGTSEARTWRVWVTYHNYYKAPDLIGPKVAEALGIPYVQVESTRARKRLAGAWATFAAAAEAASDAAHTIFYLTHRDAETLRRDAPPGQALRHLPPFLARFDLPAASTLTGPMITVAMMRTGDKLASFTLIAQTLARLPSDLDWRLDIAGDGEATPEVAALMAPFGTRVRLLGALGPAALADLYATGRILVWPGVNEAFGLVYLEAQAAGIPTVAQDRPGVCDVVIEPRCDVQAGPAAMADRITTLLRDHQHLNHAATQARKAVAERHLLSAAARTLNTTLEGLA